VKTVGLMPSQTAYQNSGLNKGLEEDQVTNADLSQLQTVFDRAAVLLKSNKLKDVGCQVVALLGGAWL
jgi:hypothetical protein